MRRVIVAGGTGFFGRAALDQLAQRGIPALTASRSSGADLQLDVENANALRRTLRDGDVVIDTVGPFQDRSTKLVETAIEIGSDLIDISDSLAYAQRVYALRESIAAAGIRVLPSCSTVSAVTALLVAASGIHEPVHISGFLVPSARYSASAATADSLLRSVGRPVQMWRDGRLQQARGWLSTKRSAFAQPIGTLRGRLFESADSVWLPQAWPSLRTVDFYVDMRIPGFDSVLALAARSSLLRGLIERFPSAGHRLARRLGRRDGCLAVEVQATKGSLARQAVYCPDHGYRLAVLPAVLAAQAIVEGRQPAAGLITPQRQIDPAELSRAIREAGFLLA
jgi:saccharopine dehydrogenase-like NADP-dependent oxidoreductase